MTLEPREAWDLVERGRAHGHASSSCPTAGTTRPSRSHAHAHARRRADRRHPVRPLPHGIADPWAVRRRPGRHARAVGLRDRRPTSPRGRPPPAAAATRTARSPTPPPCCSGSPGCGAATVAGRVSLAGAAVDLFDAGGHPLRGRRARRALRCRDPSPTASRTRSTSACSAPKACSCSTSSASACGCTATTACARSSRSTPGAGEYECLVPPNRFIDLITGASDENNSDARRRRPFRRADRRPAALVGAGRRDRRHHPRPEGHPVTDTPAVLSGYRVLDCSIAMAGPFAAQRLGDLGADVDQGRADRRRVAALRRRRRGARATRSTCRSSR